MNNPLINPKAPYQMPINIHQEKEQINFDTGYKMDDRLFSAKINNINERNNANLNNPTDNYPYSLSNSKGAFNNINTLKPETDPLYGYTRQMNNNGTNSTNFWQEQQTSGVYSTLGQLQGGNINNHQGFKSKSHQIFCSLMIKNKFSKGLLPGKGVNYDTFMHLPQELSYINCTQWIERYKEFLIGTLIEDLINEHDNNLININKALEFANIQLIQTSPEDELNSITEQLQKKFNENNLIRQSQHQPFAKDHSTTTQQSTKIFFGDNRSINMIIQFIDCKLRQIKQNDKDSFRTNSNSRDGSNSPIDKTEEFLSNLLKKKNPFLKKEINYDYKDLINKNQLQLEESFITLKHYLIYRILLNEKLFTKLFINSINEKHSHLIIEYSIGRLRELKSNFAQYKNNSGGRFLNENWSTVFPTDSQLISYLSIQFLEDVYKNTAQKKLFLISFPLAPKLEKNSNNLYIYQTNAEDTEPYFLVIYQDMMINCEEKDNFFHSFVVFLYLMKVKEPKLMHSLNLGYFIQKIIR